MLQNAYFLAKIGADTAENERKFAKNWQPYGSTRRASFDAATAATALARAEELVPAASITS